MAVVEVIVRNVDDGQIMFDELVMISDDLNTGAPNEYAVYSALTRAILVHAVNMTRREPPETT